MKVKTKFGIILVAALMMVLAACMFSYADDATTSASTMPKDGTYTMGAVTCLTEGRMFKVAEVDCNTCQVTVKDGKATAHLRLNKTGYDYVFVGTTEEAEADTAQSNWIKYSVDNEGYYVYDIPIENLNVNFDLASHSKSSGNWFPRSLIVFPAATTTTISSLKTEGRSATISWKKQSMNNLTGYAVQYAMKKDFSDADDPVYVNKNKTSATIKGLKPGIKYYFRVTTYRHFDQDNTGTYDYHFKWSKTASTLSKTKIKSLKAGKKKATVKIAKKSGCKYQIRYSRKSSMKSAKSIKTSSTKKTVKKLKSKKRYYFQVRTYKKVNGATIYSDWSSKKSVKVK